MVAVVVVVLVLVVDVPASLLFSLLVSVEQRNDDLWYHKRVEVVRDGTTLWQA